MFHLVAVVRTHASEPALLLNYLPDLRFAQGNQTSGPRTTDQGTATLIHNSKHTPSNLRLIWPQGPSWFPRFTACQQRPAVSPHRASQFAGLHWLLARGQPALRAPR